jgi:hypothetical protein
VTIFGLPPLRACRRSCHEWPATPRPSRLHLYWSSGPTPPRRSALPRALWPGVGSHASIALTAAASGIGRERYEGPGPELDAGCGACAALWIAARIRAAWCGLTFELKPTTEVGGVRLDCDDASGPQASLTLPAVVGRRLERGVRPQFAEPLERRSSCALSYCFPFRAVSVVRGTFLPGPANGQRRKGSLDEYIPERGILAELSLCERAKRDNLGVRCSSPLNKCAE